MDKSLHTQLDLSPVNPGLLETTDESIRWLRRPVAGLRMIDDDEFEEDDFTDDDLEEDEDLDEDLDEDDDWDEDDDLEEDEDLDEDDFDDDFDDEDLEDDADEYEYEYRGDPSWDGDDYDEDEYNLLGTRFASLLDDPPAGPKRFRDRDGLSRGDKKPKKSRPPRIAKRSQDEIENDDD